MAPDPRRNPWQELIDDHFWLLAVTLVCYLLIALFLF